VDVWEMSDTPSELPPFPDIIVDCRSAGFLRYHYLWRANGSNQRRRFWDNEAKTNPSTKLLA
jgi:hypothetical protein